MLVCDLRHFLDPPEQMPGSARRLAERLGSIVRAATAGPVGAAWPSALGCRRRPANRRCPGRLLVSRPEPSGPIHWRCSGCGDDGVISGWEGSPFDLGRRRPVGTGSVNEITVPLQVAAALQELWLLDADAERVVFGARARGDSVVVSATAGELDELIGAVAAGAQP